MSGWRREGRRITASPDLNTPFPASANLFSVRARPVTVRLRNTRSSGANPGIRHIQKETAVDRLAPSGPGSSHLTFPISGNAFRAHPVSP